MSNPITSYDDTIDSRDVIERIEELVSEFVFATEEAENTPDIEDTRYTMTADDWRFGLNAEDAEELYNLLQFEHGANCVSDWNYGETFISDGHFTDYAKNLVEDCGYINADTPYWITDAIDWDRVADTLISDYTDYEFDGATYWARA